MNKHTFKFKKVTPCFTFLAMVFLSLSAFAQVQQNGTLYVGGNAVVSIFGAYTFGTTSGAASQTDANASYGRLYFGSNASTSGAVAAHHLNGYATTVNNADFTLPLGNGSIYAPLRVRPANSTKEIDAAYKASAATGTLDGATLTAISASEYWDVPNSADAAAQLTLSWGSTSNLSSLSVFGGTTIQVSDIVIAGYNSSSSKWELIESTVDATNYFDNTASSLTKGSITSNSVVSFGTYTKFTLATKGACSFAAVTPSGNTCTWTNVWSPNAPTLADRAVINAISTSSTGSFQCYELTLNADIVLTAGQSIEMVTGLTAASSKKITMASTSSILQRQSGTPPLVSIIKDINVKRNDFVHFGLPVNAPNTPIATTFAPFLDGTNTPANPFDEHKRYYTGSTGFGWSANPITNTPDLLGLGFYSRVADIAPYNTADTAIDIKIEGTANTGDITINSMSNNPSSPFGGSSCPFIANPYPSGLDAIKFIEANPGLDGTVYVWTSYSQHNNLAISTGSSDYMAYNKSGTIGAPLGSGLTFNGIISSAQGFRVRILEDQVGTAQQTRTITFNNCMRSATPHNFFRSAQQNSTSDTDRFKLNITGANNIFSQILIGYFPEATYDYDRMYDAVILSGSNLRLYSFLQPSNTATKLSINARPPFQITDVVALGLSKATTNLETFSIAIAEQEGVFAGDTVDVILHDLVANVYHNLSNGPYTLMSNTINLTDRFQVKYQNRVLSNPDFDSTAVFVSLQEHTLAVSAQLPIAQITVYDLTGRLISTIPGHQQTKITENFDFASGIYVAKVKLTSGAVVTQKLINSN